MLLVTESIVNIGILRDQLICTGEGGKTTTNKKTLKGEFQPIHMVTNNKLPHGETNYTKLRVGSQGGPFQPSCIMRKKKLC